MPLPLLDAMITSAQPAVQVDEHSRRIHAGIDKARLDADIRDFSRSVEGRALRERDVEVFLRKGLAGLRVEVSQAEADGRLAEARRRLQTARAWPRGLATPTASGSAVLSGDGTIRYV